MTAFSEVHSCCSCSAVQGAAAALNRDRYGGFHDRHTHGGHVPNPPRLSGSATYRPQLLSGSTLGQSLKRNDSGSRCQSHFCIHDCV